MKVTKITRGHVLVEVGNMTVKVDVEMLVPTPGLSDYLVYRDSISRENQPSDSDKIDQVTREAIVREVCDTLSKMGRVVEVV
jgi:hypothetical protein